MLVVVSCNEQVGWQRADCFARLRKVRNDGVYCDTQLAVIARHEAICFMNTWVIDISVVVVSCSKRVGWQRADCFASYARLAMTVFIARHSWPSLRGTKQSAL